MHAHVRSDHWGELSVDDSMEFEMRLGHKEVTHAFFKTRSRRGLLRLIQHMSARAMNVLIINSINQHLLGYHAQPHPHLKVAFYNLALPLTQRLPLQPDRFINGVTLPYFQATTKVILIIYRVGVHPISSTLFILAYEYCP